MSKTSMYAGFLAAIPAAVVLLAAAACHPPTTPTVVTGPTSGPTSTAGDPNAMVEEWVTVPARILYPDGGSKLDDQGEAMSRELRAALANRGDIVGVAVEGHADSGGSAGANHALGMKRAQGVVNHMVDDLGMPRELFKVNSHGDARPITSDTTSADRVQNRRVEVKVLVRRPRGSRPAAAPSAVMAASRAPMPVNVPSATGARGKTLRADAERSAVNPFRLASQESLATFSLDVDTASYTLMRSSLQSGYLPSPPSVRVEEYVNFFDYNEAPPRTRGNTPFAVHVESAPSHFGENLNLLRVGVQGVEVPAGDRPAANLVFLVDVSGSMNSAAKLGLVQFALTTLVNTLRPDDTIGIVVYAGREGIALEPTDVANRGTLLRTIESLSAGGSTNGESGIRAAYDLAQQHFRRGGINRVILCTDGDFNVGLTGTRLIGLIERYRRRNINLTVLGFGRHSNDHDMEQLADRGNGSYAFIDSRNEALRVLQRNLQGTLQVIAADVKVQVSFNPEVVSRFRLIGYENRVLAHQDFDNDAIDAAEVGSGQFVTALLEYELLPGVTPPRDRRELATIRLRYKPTQRARSVERRVQVRVRDIRPSFAEASRVFRFSAAVAEFAEVLRRSEHSEGARFDDIVRVARSSTWSQSSDSQEFVTLVRRAQELWQRQASVD